MSHFPFPISPFPFLCLCPFSIIVCPFPIAHVRPGGMRGAIESAALAVWQELACRIESTSPHLRSHLADLRPPQNLPQRPRAFRPAASKCAPDRFCDFQKTIASAEPAAKNLSPTGFDATLHRKCKLQDAAFMLFMLQLTFYITIFQKCCSCLGGEHNFAKRFHALVIENSTFLTLQRPR